MVHIRKVKIFCKIQKKIDLLFPKVGSLYHSKYTRNQIENNSVKNCKFAFQEKSIRC
jgi:hypothetical protein